MESLYQNGRAQTQYCPSLKPFPIYQEVGFPICEMFQSKIENHPERGHPCLKRVASTSSMLCTCTEGMNVKGSMFKSSLDNVKDSRHKTRANYSSGTLSFFFLDWCYKKAVETGKISLRRECISGLSRFTVFNYFQRVPI